MRAVGSRMAVGEADNSLVLDEGPKVCQGMLEASFLQLAMVQTACAVVVDSAAGVLEDADEAFVDVADLASQYAASAALVDTAYP